MARETRKRILVASLLLFNEKGVARTSINEIADEVGISPGNLHYHFRKKSEIVDGLMAEFQADARATLRPPEQDTLTLDDFWWFLHGLLELTAAYRFLLRDTEALVADYPKVGRSLKHFAKGLNAVFELYLLGLVRGGALGMDLNDIHAVGKNLAVIALLSERFDVLIGTARDADEAALVVARSILSVLKPFAAADAAQQLGELATHYSE